MTRAALRRPVWAAVLLGLGLLAGPSPAAARGQANIVPFLNVYFEGEPPSGGVMQVNTIAQNQTDEFNYSGALTFDASCAGCSGGALTRNDHLSFDPNPPTSAPIGSATFLVSFTAPGRIGRFVYFGLKPRKPTPEGSVTANVLTWGCTAPGVVPALSAFAHGPRHVAREVSCPPRSRPIVDVEALPDGN